MPESLTRAVVRPNLYADSITLLQATAAVSARSGVLEAALVMATPLNLEVLRDAGLFDGAAGPNDLVVAVRAESATAADAALQHALELIVQRRAKPTSESQVPPRSIRGGHRRMPAANLAVISVPGPYAAAEARQALAEGLHVFLFSDNVSLEDELDLKRRGREAGLLVMGPDCGTAIINGVGLGFANVVRRGHVGLIGASGTGLQEVACLLDRAGVGISHAIGTGGRDLHAFIGGIATSQALDMLSRDPETETIVLLGKPPAPQVAERVLAAAAASGKPVVACLLGNTATAPSGVQMASNLAEAARLAGAGAAVCEHLEPSGLTQPRLRPGQRVIRGLFCGGTLCEEAELALGSGVEARFDDFGDDRFTRGRAHPMIDPTLRNRALLEAAADPTIAVIVVDVILGFGSHPDPAGALVGAVRDAVVRAAAAGREIAIVAHVVGTDRDPQGLEQQEATLRDAGVQLVGSNQALGTAASLLVKRGSA